MLRRLLSDRSGLGAVEFAMLAPVLVGLLVGITQLGALYFANADLRSAVAAGARAAQVFPRPSTDAIKAAINAKVLRLKAGKITGPTVTYDRTASGYDYATIEVRYAVPLNFVIYKPPPVTLVEQRRVYLQPA